MKTYCISTDSACGKTAARNLREAFDAFRLPFETASQWEAGIAALGGWGTITEDGVVIARVPCSSAPRYVNQVTDCGVSRPLSRSIRVF